MGKMTVNELMVMSKAIRGRLGELSSLRQNSSTRDVFSYGSTDKKTVEPLYDVKALDKRCCELENFLLQADTKIKQSNAITIIDIDADVSKLLEPIS